MADKRVPIPYPAKGISENYGFSYQEELTCRDERNMRVRDPRTGRLRGAQRGGMSLFNDDDTPVNGSEKVTALGQVSSARSQITYGSGGPFEEATNAGDNESANAVGVRYDRFDNYYVAYDNGVITVHNSAGSLLHTLTIPSEAWTSGSYIADFCVDRYQNVFVAPADAGYPSGVPRAVLAFELQLDGSYAINAYGSEQQTYGGTNTGQVIGVCAVVDDSDNDILYALWTEKNLTNVEYALQWSGSPTNAYETVILAKYTDYLAQGDDGFTKRNAWRIPRKVQTGTTPGSGVPISENGDGFGVPMTLNWSAYTGQLEIGPDGNICGFYAGWTDNGDLEFGHTFSMSPVPPLYGTDGNGSTYSSWKAQHYYERNPLPFGGSNQLYYDLALSNGTCVGIDFSGRPTGGSGLGFYTIGDTWVGKQTMFSIDATPLAGDKLTIYGPRYDNPAANATLNINWIAGTAAPSCTGSGTSTINVNIPVGWAPQTQPWQWRYLLCWYATLARTDTTFCANYTGPNVWLAPSTPGSETATVAVTHPKPAESLSVSEAYWRVDHSGGSWTNTPPMVSNAFTDVTRKSLQKWNVFSAWFGTILAGWSHDFGNEFVQSATTVPQRKRYISSDSKYRMYFPWGETSDVAAYSGKPVLIHDDDDGTGSWTAIDASNPASCYGVAPHLQVPEDIPDSIPHTDFIVAAGPRDTGVTGNPSAYWYRIVSITQSGAQSPRDVHRIAVAGTKIRKLTSGGPADVHNGTVIDSSAPYVQIATGFEKLYIADGNKYWIYDPLKTDNSANGEVSQLVAQSLGLIPPRCRLIETWRDRVVIGRDPADPGRWHMSAIGNATDWDFFPQIDTSAKAVTATATKAGRVPDVVNAICPWSEDLLIFGGDRSLWQLTGDPAAGGVLDLISDETGMSFGRPYCKDPEGGLWFFGSNGGLYYMQRGSVPTRVSLGRVEAQLRSVDLSSYYIQLQWNPIDEGVHIFQLPFGSGGAIVDHWFYEVPTGAWHKDRFGAKATDLIQPTATLRIDGDLPADRTTLVAGEDGRMRVLPVGATTARKSDQRTASEDIAIDSYVLMGPLVSNPVTNSQQVSEFAAVLSSSQDGCNYEFFASDNPEDLGAAVSSGELRAGRNDRRLVRVNNDHVYLRLRNARAGQSWAYEGGSINVAYGGEVRR